MSGCPLRLRCVYRHTWGFDSPFGYYSVGLPFGVKPSYTSYQLARMFGNVKLNLSEDKSMTSNPEGFERRREIMAIVREIPYAKIQAYRNKVYRAKTV